MLDLDEREECWHPYHEWAKTLQPGWDTVIAFNYDLVPDHLAGRDGSKLKVLLPSECPKDPSQRRQDAVPVLKLHGSVDWKKDEGGQIVRGNLKEILASEQDTVFIAAPGRSKQDAVQELKPLWEQARRALRYANALVVLGYGFPATDTMARREIQSAFTAGSPGSDVRRIDVVLGPDTSRPEARRVHALLEGFKGQRRLVVAPEKVPPSQPGHKGALHIKVHHLFAEDFIFDYRQRTEDA
ncbi:MAG TPA: hypothetical protein VJ801_04990 [Polyangia bacterium]|nr:hypothetical protein [Polyangia bacterium]